MNDSSCIILERYFFFFRKVYRISGEMGKRTYEQQTIKLDTKTAPWDTDCNRTTGRSTAQENYLGGTSTQFNHFYQKHLKYLGIEGEYETDSSDSETEEKPQALGFKFQPFFGTSEIKIKKKLAQIAAQVEKQLPPLIKEISPFRSGPPLPRRVGASPVLKNLSDLADSKVPRPDGKRRFNPSDPYGRIQKGSGGNSLTAATLEDQPVRLNNYYCKNAHAEALQEREGSHHLTRPLLESNVVPHTSCKRKIEPLNNGRLPNHGPYAGVGIAAGFERHVVALSNETPLGSKKSHTGKLSSAVCRRIRQALERQKALSAMANTSEETQSTNKTFW